LGSASVRFVSGGDRPVKKVGLCSGSGAEFIERAAFMGCDAFVTGDVRYHDAQRAAALGVHVIDAGHFATEQPVVEILAARLREELAGKAEVTADDRACDFFETV
jgi:putative NIF3 family GTP cyclohydrolase 1 type 2